MVHKRFSSTKKRVPRKVVVVKKKKRSTESSKWKIYSNPFTRLNDKVKLTYFETTTYDPSPDTIASGNLQVWQGNNLFDPNNTGTGHQPMYFDNYAALYSRYSVDKFKVTVSVLNYQVNTATDVLGSAVVLQPNYMYRVCLWEDDQPNDFASLMSTMIEEKSKSLVWKYVTPNLTGKPSIISKTCIPNKLTNLPFHDDTLQAAVGAGPSNGAYMSCAICSADGSTDPPANSIYTATQIDFWITFTDRKTTQTQN